MSHAQNPANSHFEDSKELLEKLADSTTLLCMDGRFTTGAGNSSLIGQEYLQNVGFGGIAFAVLQLLMQSGRIKVVPLKISLNDKKTIDALVPHNRRDRTFVKVAYNSSERRLASHDYIDFSVAVRNLAKTRLGVRIEDAADVHRDIEPIVRSLHFSISVRSKVLRSWPSLRWARDVPGKIGVKGSRSDSRWGPRRRCGP